MRRSLRPEFVAGTAQTLRRRVEERFPGSGLAQVALEVEKAAAASDAGSLDAARPYWSLRVSVWALLAGLAAGVPFAFRNAGVRLSFSSAGEFLTGAESAANLVVLLGAGVYSLIKLEEKLQRGKALTRLHELRALAHVVDMHQLTKDPDALGRAPATSSSPKRTMTRAELGRYLDYCSEMLSLIGKSAAVYAQRLQDPVVLETVDGLEDLTTGLSRKIWQKIALLDRAAPPA